MMNDVRSADGGAVASSAYAIYFGRNFAPKKRQTIYQPWPELYTFFDVLFNQRKKREIC